MTLKRTKNKSGDFSLLTRRTLLLLLSALVSSALLGCHSPRDSQIYFAQAAVDDPLVEPIYQTGLYSVYYDHGLRKCVLHSAHTWGESGGGGGGTGLGVAVFNCDPNRIKARIEALETQYGDGRPLPVHDVTKPASSNQGAKPLINNPPSALPSSASKNKKKNKASGVSPAESQKPASEQLKQPMVPQPVLEN